MLSRVAASVDGMLEEGRASCLRALFAAALT